MELIQGIENLTEENRPSAATIGNFDGVHRGHEMVISTLISAANERQVKSTVVTFDPLAKEFFAPQHSVRLHTLEQRILRIEELGVDQVLVLPFDKKLAALSPKKFVDDVLVSGLGLVYLSVGDDFKFGQNREGDFEYLSLAGQNNGFDVQAHETYTIDGERVSSGRLREALKMSDFDDARRLLGRAYQLSGTVSVGQQRGRTIGFPTANISLDARNFAVSGVYAVWVELTDGRKLKGVANIGHRPTVDGQENRLEVHIFDFSEDIYGQSIAVEFVAKIRDEVKFDDFSLLQEQIKLDANEARKCLL